jgi:hypothetical protein
MPRNKPSPGALRKSRKRVSARAGRAKKPVKTGGRKAATFSGKARPGKSSPRPEKSTVGGAGATLTDLDDADDEHIEELLLRVWPKTFTKTPPGGLNPVDEVEQDSYLAADAVGEALRTFDRSCGRLPDAIRDRLAVCMGRVWLTACDYIAEAEWKRRHACSERRHDRKRELNRTFERDKRICKRFDELVKDLPGKVQRYEALAQEFELDVRQIQRIVKAGARADEAGAHAGLDVKMAKTVRFLEHFVDPGS